MDPATTPRVDARQIWQAALGELQLQMTKATFDTWLKGTYAIAYEDGTFIIGTHSTYAKEWLENRLATQIKRTLCGLLGRSVEVKFVVRPPAPPEMESTPLFPGTSPSQASPREARSFPSATNSELTMLNSRYTFETFIVGSSNRMAHAAAMAVAENPTQRYNPLFIYGGVGLGKTHLLHAVGHIPAKQNLRVLYVTSEQFTNDLINAIRSQTTEEFRYKYRQVDVLLVDDIQFIAGKESTQEEFFHTFNTLHEADKQIVLTSDRLPSAIATLEERLCSRFQWGLTVDIQPPDLETRIAILRFKSEGQPIPVPTGVIEFIAHKIQHNIRELEGALNQVVAYAQWMGCPLTTETATATLHNLLARHEPPSLEAVLAAVADFYRVTPEDLRGRGRSKGIALPRQVAMYLMRTEADASLPQIGQELGGRDHTTALYGCDKIAVRQEQDEQLRRDLLAIKEILYNHVVPR
jgi:chromosomal replication initiator protein